MLTLTAQELPALVATLSKTNLIRLLRIVLAVQDKEVLTPLMVNTAYLYEWLLHLRMIDEQQARRIVAECQPQLRCFSEQLQAFETRSSGKRPNLIVTISDSRYASWAGPPQIQREFFDLVTDGYLGVLPEELVTHISCDLFALAERNRNGGRNSMDLNIMPAPSLTTLTPQRTRRRKSYCTRSSHA